MRSSQKVKCFWGVSDLVILYFEDDWRLVVGDRARVYIDRYNGKTGLYRMRTDRGLFVGREEECLCVPEFRMRRPIAGGPAAHAGFDLPAGPASARSHQE